MSLVLFKSTQVNLPIELIKIILDSITETETYKKARLVCKDWYYYLRILKSFENNVLIRLLEFKKTNIICRDINNKIIFEYIDKKYGNSVYKNYNSRGVLIKMVTTVVPYYIKIWSVENNIVNTKIIDIKTTKIKESSYALIPGCIII